MSPRPLTFSSSTSSPSSSSLVDSSLLIDIISVMRSRERRDLSSSCPLMASSEFGDLTSRRTSFHYPDPSPYRARRRDLVERVIRTCETFSFQNETTFQACELMDRVFCSPKFNSPSREHRFSLIALACVMIAAKVNEVKVLSVPELLECSEDGELDNPFLPATRIFCQIELAVLECLEWRLLSQTPFGFAKFFLFQITGEENSTQQDIELHRATVLHLGIALQHIEFTSVLPSQVAAAAVWCALAHQMPGLAPDSPISSILMETVDPEVQNELDIIFGFPLNDLKDVCDGLWFRVNEFHHRKRQLSLESAEKVRSWIDEQIASTDQLDSLDSISEESMLCRSMEDQMPGSSNALDES